MGNLVKSYKDFMKERNNSKKPDGCEIQKAPEIDKAESYDQETETIELKHQQQNDDKCPRCGKDAEHCTCGEDPWSTNVSFRAPKGDVVNAEPKQNFKNVKNNNTI